MRLYGINWDQGHHLHPDERFLTMVSTAISWPQSFGQYFNTKTSPLNPRNQGYDFFVYGTFPIFITKAVAELFNWGDYMHLTLVGRFLSALADLGVVFLLYKLTKKIWASLLYALMVLPIQLAHFYAVDPWLNLFLVLSFYGAFNWPIWLVGIFLGLAMSSKVTAVLFIPVLFLVILKRYRKINLELILNSFYLILTTSVTTRIFSPYSFTNLFSLNPKFIMNLEQLRSHSRGEIWYPPGIQWIKTKSIIFPTKNIILWGLGIPLALFVTIALLHYSFKALKRILEEKKLTIQQFSSSTICLIWILFLFIFQGVQFCKTMRYFLPIYPFMALIAGKFWLKIKLPQWVKAVIIGSLFFWPLAFMNIYTQTHPRIKASKWIYENVPPGSTLSCELWDDCLPLSFEDNYAQQYETQSLAVFNPDNPQKWQKIDQQLKEIDYLILSSGRAWEPIMENPNKYPQMSKFYERLFNGDLDFEKAAEFTSYPSLEIVRPRLRRGDPSPTGRGREAGGNWKLEISDDTSEEAFTVYDHPKVLIFKKQID